MVLTRSKRIIKSLLSLGTKIMNKRNGVVLLFIYDVENKYSNGQRYLRYIVTEHDGKKRINPTAF